MLVTARTRIPSYEQIEMDSNLKDIVRGAISVLCDEGYCHVDLRKHKCDNFIKMFKDNFEQKYKHMPDAIKEAGPKPIEKKQALFQVAGYPD